jgi:hypothetical protein
MVTAHIVHQESIGIQKKYKSRQLFKSLYIIAKKEDYKVILHERHLN